MPIPQKNALSLPLQPPSINNTITFKGAEKAAALAISNNVQLNRTTDLWHIYASAGCPSI